MPDAPLRAREQRHRRRGEGGEADPDPARRPDGAPPSRSRDRLDADVGGEHEVARGDQLLRTPLGALGVEPRPPVKSQMITKPAARLDQAVGAEPDRARSSRPRCPRRSRSRTRPGASRCRPRRASSRAVQLQPLFRIEPRRLSEDAQLAARRGWCGWISPGRSVVLISGGGDSGRRCGRAGSRRGGRCASSPR